MDGWEDSQPASQSQQSNSQYHMCPQFSLYNHVPWNSNSTPGVNMAGQYCNNQSAQVFNYFHFVV